MKIAELNVSSGIDDLESLISSTLSSDITLFEKISSSTYRLRINSSEDEVEELRSDSEDSGTVDDDLSDSGICSSDDDSGCNSGNPNIRKSIHVNRHRSKTNMRKVHTEIDESHPGEVWLLGLMEGEYSDLSIEEKLNAIVALIDLLHAGSNMRMEVMQTILAWTLKYLFACNDICILNTLTYAYKIGVINIMGVNSYQVYNEF